MQLTYATLIRLDLRKEARVTWRFLSRVMMLRTPEPCGTCPSNLPEPLKRSEHFPSSQVLLYILPQSFPSLLLTPGKWALTKETGPIARLSEICLFTFKIEEYLSVLLREEMGEILDLGSWDGMEDQTYPISYAQLTRQIACTWDTCLVRYAPLLCEGMVTRRFDGMRFYDIHEYPNLTIWRMVALTLQLYDSSVVRFRER
ncbi:hypothetical protein VNO77_30183 [Canavalia gladiata]|uniref:Uncharacterized protein n=1 Tax=Canavalia gladiata TaxID=3824 RepID=A0AAN9KQL3_CANGL